MALTLHGAADILQRAERTRAEVEAVGAKLTEQVAALHADTTRTPQYRAQAERELRDAAQTEAARLLAERDTLPSLERAAAAEVRWTRDAILRRATVTDGTNPTLETMTRLDWRAELAHLHVNELEDVYAEAALDGGLWIQRQAVRELQRRAAAGDTNAAQTARRVGEQFERQDVPEAQRAAEVFAGIKRARREVENAFSSILRPVTPTARLQAVRAGGDR